jgi:N6-adenosine-specific RNA methylase IME4
MIDVPSPNGMTSKRKARPNQGKYLPYKTMSWEEIRNFPINEFADEECLMFFWTTDKFIVEAHKTIEEWGFKKHCIFVWNKPTGVCPFSVQFCNEYCLLCYRGKFKLNKIGIKTWFNERVREHSRKPNKIYEIAEQLGNAPRIDIFAREKRDGWDVWGDETNKFGASHRENLNFVEYQLRGSQNRCFALPNFYSVKTLLNPDIMCPFADGSQINKFAPSV